MTFRAFQPFRRQPFRGSVLSRGLSGGLIGVAGEQGFGVGVCPYSLPSGFSELSGTQDKSSDNYGNYQYSDGSICVFVPRFYYRIGAVTSPRYATYGANAVDIAGVDTYVTEAEANADGFVLHRAFKDGGEVKSGFFVDKYINSKDTDTGLAHGSSLKDGVPISLTTSSAYTGSSPMTDCAGQVHDAITLSRARGTGWQCLSAFQSAALSLLSLAHGQAASAATHCAWYDAAGTTNFPKGCNNNALGDSNDAAIAYTSAGDSGSASKPLTGSANHPARVAHNGQVSGVMDLNGSMWEMIVGATTYGASATDSSQRAANDPDVGKLWTLKDSVAIATLTAGWDGATDHWQSAANINTLYDELADGMWWSATAAAWTRYGNGAEQVFSGSLSGSGYLRTSIAHPLDAGVSVGGSNLFGEDGLYQYQRRNVALVAGGNWNGGFIAGVWSRRWDYRRVFSGSLVGFRSAAYGQ